MDFLELRSLGGTIDLPAYFQNKDPGARRPGQPVRVVATSLCLIGSSPRDLAEFYRFAALARQLRAPYLRVFGKGGDAAGKPSAQELEEAARCMDQVRKGLSQLENPCEPLLETHDAFSYPEACAALNSLLEKPVLILWDSHHTWRVAGESPEDSWRQLGDLVRHVHYKDSLPGNGPSHPIRYTIPGGGCYPTCALRDLLQKVNYTGGISLEWEKLWHPELPPLETALPKFRDLFPRRSQTSFPPS